MIVEKDTAGWKFYQRHLGYFHDKDVEGLLANDYHDDAELVAGEFAAKGRDALRQVFQGYLQMIGDFEVTTTEKFMETEDVILLEATMETTRAGTRKVYDVFVMKDGKISYHITGLR